MRVILTLLVLILVAAGCAPRVPDSGAGVGFDNSLEQQRAREAALAGQAPEFSPLPPATALSQETLPPASAALGPDASPQDIAAEAAAALQATSANSGVAPLQASPDNPPPPQVNSALISDEQDFEAVAERQSIESDAARIEANRQQYEVVQPTAVPDRAGNTGPNIVEYALATSHPPGTRLYSRTGVNLEARAQRKCAGYPSPDTAQIDFLASGGPQRDREGLDPDGDGYACGWDPTPFRAAVRN